MFLDLTWFDLILTVLFAGVIVLGARRGVAGLVAGVVAVFAWPIINLLGRIDPLVGFFLALVGGWFVVGTLARNAYATGFINASSDVARTILGGLGGALMGTALVVALALSFPITSTPSAGAGAFSYPSDALPSWLREFGLLETLCRAGSKRKISRGRHLENTVPNGVLLFDRVELEGSRLEHQTRAVDSSPCC